MTDTFCIQLYSSRFIHLLIWAIYEQQEIQCINRLYRKCRLVTKLIIFWWRNQLFDCVSSTVAYYVCFFYFSFTKFTLIKLINTGFVILLSVYYQAARILGPPSTFEASKLKVEFVGEEMNKQPFCTIPRAYTLTHCDLTANLTLAVSSSISSEQVWSNKLFFPQLMRHFLF